MFSTIFESLGQIIQRPSKEGQLYKFEIAVKILDVPKLLENICTSGILNCQRLSED